METSSSSAEQNRWAEQKVRHKNGMKNVVSYQKETPLTLHMYGLYSGLDHIFTHIKGFEFLH